MANDLGSGPYDLFRAIMALPEIAAYQSLKGKARQTLGAHSARADLEMAQEATAALEKLMDPMLRGNADGPDAHALFSYAVVLYARATKSESGHRVSFTLRGMFSPEQLSAHEALCKLRDDGVAHFGPGGRAGDQAWASETLILVPDGHQHRIGGVTRRMVIDSHLLEQLVTQIEVAAALVEGIFQGKLLALSEALTAEVWKDRRLVDALVLAPFDASSFLGDWRAADQMLQSVRSGAAKGLAGGDYRLRNVRTAKS